MGRGRGKGKKFSAANHDDNGSGEEEKIPVQKRRGRPQKPLKDDIDEEEEESDKVEDEDTKNGASPSKEAKSSITTENGKRRKRNLQAKESLDTVKMENGVGSRSTSTDDSTKSNGFRHNGSRRKSKPRRAAEAGVACQ